MPVKFSLHTAYSYSPKFKNYFAAAYILESNHPGLPKGDTFKTSCRTGMGDTKEEALNEAVARATEGKRFERIDERTDHGRKRHDFVAGYVFP